jgi:hypothetical protein
MKYFISAVITLSAVTFPALLSAPAFALEQIRSEHSFICGGGHGDMGSQDSTGTGSQNN